jgi:hypothetical protein
LSPQVHDQHRHEDHDHVDLVHGVPGEDGSSFLGLPHVDKDLFQKGHRWAPEGHSKDRLPHEVAQLELGSIASSQKGGSKPHDIDLLVVRGFKSSGNAVDVATLKSTVHSTHESLTLIEGQLKLLACVDKPLVSVRRTTCWYVTATNTDFPELIVAVQIDHRTESSSGNHLSFDTSELSGIPLRPKTSDRTTVCMRATELIQPIGTTRMPT